MRLSLAGLALVFGLLASPERASADVFGSSMGVRCEDALCTTLVFMLDVEGTPSVDTMVWDLSVTILDLGAWSFGSVLSVRDGAGTPISYTYSVLADGSLSLVTENVVAVEPLTVRVSTAGGTYDGLTSGFAYAADGFEYDPSGPAIWTTSGLTSIDTSVPTAGLVTPEPVTFVLLATGFASLGLVGIIRRRNLEVRDAEES